MKPLGRISLLLGAFVLVVFGVVCLKQQFGPQSPTPSFVSTDSQLDGDLSGGLSNPTILSAEPYSDQDLSSAGLPFAELSPVPIDGTPTESFSFPANATLPEVSKERPAVWNDVQKAPRNVPSESRTVSPAASPAPAEFVASTDVRPLPNPTGADSTPTKVTTVADDSLWKISEQIYGRGEYFKALYLHNRTLLPRPDHIPAGIELATPSVEELHRLYPKECPPADSQ